MGRLDVSFLPNAAAPEDGNAKIRAVILQKTLARALSEEPEQFHQLREALRKVVHERRDLADSQRDAPEPSQPGGQG